MLSGLGSACGRAAQTAGTAPALESPPAKRSFTGFNYPWGSHHGGDRVVTSGFTPTSVLVPPEPPPADVLASGACSNMCA